MTALKTAEMTEIDFSQEAGKFSSPLSQVPPQVPALAPEPTTILNIIERASRDPNVDIDKMERLIAMQERVQARSAQVEFDNAMASAQEEMKAIRADLANNQTKSKYASYAALDHAIRPIYTKHGFAVSLNTGDAPTPDAVRVLATVSHRGGHRQDYRIDMPADGKGPQGASVMTRTHATGAAASYGQRYISKLIWNLAVGEVDDDGNGADGDVEGLAGPDALRNKEGQLLSSYASNKAKDYTSRAIENINLSANAEAVKDWRREQFKAPKGSNVSPLAWLEFNAPSQFQRVKMAYENVTGEQW
jgi:hypothetical protein